MSAQLEITDLKVHPVKGKEDGTLAYVTATFNDALIVSNIRIKEGVKGIYIEFPLQRALDGKQYPIVYPSSGDSRKEISNRILATYVVNHCVDGVGV